MINSTFVLIIVEMSDQSGLLESSPYSSYGVTVVKNNNPTNIPRSTGYMEYGILNSDNVMVEVVSEDGDRQSQKRSKKYSKGLKWLLFSLIVALILSLLMGQLHVLC